MLALCAEVRELLGEAQFIDASRWARAITERNWFTNRGDIDWPVLQSVAKFIQHTENEEADPAGSFLKFAQSYLKEPKTAFFDTEDLGCKTTKRAIVLLLLRLAESTEELAEPPRPKTVEAKAFLVAAHKVLDGFDLTFVGKQPRLEQGFEVIQSILNFLKEFDETRTPLPNYDWSSFRNRVASLDQAFQAERENANPSSQHSIDAVLKPPPPQPQNMPFEWCLILLAPPHFQAVKKRKKEPFSSEDEYRACILKLKDALTANGMEWVQVEHHPSSAQATSVVEEDEYEEEDDTETMGRTTGTPSDFGDEDQTELDQDDPEEHEGQTTEENKGGGGVFKHKPSLASQDEQQQQQQSDLATKPQKLKLKKVTASMVRWVVFVRLSETAAHQLLSAQSFARNKVHPNFVANSKLFGSRLGSSDHCLEIYSKLEHEVRDAVLRNKKPEGTPKIENVGIPQTKISQDSADGPDLLLFLERSFPLHDPRMNGAIVSRVAWRVVLPLDTIMLIQRQFGSEIGFYYAWLDFFIRFLLPAAVVGVVIYGLQYVYSASQYQLLYSYLMPIYGLMMIIWATLFLIFWRRREAELSLVWNSSSKQAAAVPNPTYNPRSKVKGRFRTAVLAAMVVPFMFQACLMTSFTLGLYVLTVWLYFKFPNCNAFSSEDCIWRTLYVDIGTTILYVVLIAVADYTIVAIVARRVAKLLNYEYLDDYRRVLAHMIFAFYMLDGFVWYILLAFVQIPLTGSKVMNDFLTAWLGLNFEDLKAENPLAFVELTSQANWMSFLQSVVVSYFTMTQFLPAFIEAGIPYFLRKITNNLEKRQLRKKLKEKEQHTHEMVLTSEKSGRSLTVKQTTTTTTAEASDIHSAADWSEQVQLHVMGLPQHFLHTSYADSKANKFFESAAKYRNYRKTGYVWAKVVSEADLVHFELVDDYEDLILELGYVLAFTVLWPMIAMLAWVNNQFESKMDMVRLCKGARRPTPLVLTGLGVYNGQLKTVTHLATVLTLGLCLVATHNMDVYFTFFTGTSYEDILFVQDPATNAPHLSLFIKFFIAVLVEHVLFLLQNLFTRFIPSVPDWIHQQRKMENIAIHSLVEGHLAEVVDKLEYVNNCRT